MPARLSRSAYAHMLGPTVGDRVRLADTDLIVEVVRADGELLTCEPASILPMAQRYFLF